MGKTIKVVVCGMKGVGKTAILEQVVYGNMTERTEFYPTIEDIYVANIESEKGIREKLRFYDTAGLEPSQITTANGTTNQQLPRHYLVLADGYILVYDCNKSHSLDTIISIKKDIDRNKDKKEVIEGDDLPPYICQKCISKLNIAFQFKTQCESSDAKLRQCVENFNHLLANSNISEFNVKKCNQNKSFKSDETNEHKQIMNSEGIIEIGNVEVQLQIHEQPQIVHADSSPLDDFEKGTQMKVELNDLRSHNLDLKVEGISISSSTEVKPIRFKKPNKYHQCDACGKIFRTKPGLVHHIRIHTGERPYVCHLCDKRFTNGGHLHTHMRTHTGEKNHICTTCNKAFATAQQLTKHTIAIHTSERPYGCTYCSKRFASSSNLNTHTKIHTGEKNYRCDQCGKAFSTKGQLYQHMLVHSGEKAYLCEYCNKRFSQKAHLIRHHKTHRN